MMRVVYISLSCKTLRPTGQVKHKGTHSIICIKVTSCTTPAVCRLFNNGGTYKAAADNEAMQLSSSNETCG